MRKPTVFEVLLWIAMLVSIARVATASTGDPPTHEDAVRIARAIEDNTRAIRDAARSCR